MNNATTHEQLKPFIHIIAQNETLTFEQAKSAFKIIMSGNATDCQIAAFLMGISQRGETKDEITAAVIVLREKLLPVKAPDNAIDIVGTGGDGAGTLNISTASAFVVAGCGVPVAKHGNKAASSLSGASDILASVGINLECDLFKIEHALQHANIAFLFASRHHSAMRFVGPVRTQLGIRTLFNILGPMINPASVKRLLVGCYTPTHLTLMAQTLGNLGAEKCWVVHGQGLDEIAISGPTKIVEWNGSSLNEFTIMPEDADCETHPLSQIKGGDGNYNAARMRDLLDGKHDAYREIVVLNSAAALMVAGKYANLKDAAIAARNAIDTGKARQALDSLIAITNS